MSKMQQSTQTQIPQGVSVVLQSKPQTKPSLTQNCPGPTLPAFFQMYQLQRRTHGQQLQVSLLEKQIQQRLALKKSPESLGNQD